MSTEDISRSLLQLRKHYSGVRMQQGRVLLDSDWNEHQSISNEDLRRTLAEIVCSKGTPNHGFAIDSTRAADEEVPGTDPVTTFDFDIGGGSFYLGGLRLQRETDADTQSFLNQSDWLQLDADASNLPVRPDQLPNDRTRTDLVYLRAWEQCVTAVEDSELRERALGGPDTSVRVRRMQRIEVLTDVPTNCAEAFDNLIEQLTAPHAPDQEGNHIFDSNSCELRSKAHLSIEPNPDGITDDPCRPVVPGGYLGADNQTIRVQLTATDRFIWGYDNAAPLYRVQVQDIPNDPTGARRRIQFLNLPRDQAAQPLAGQAVEIIPWGALLPNQEKVAEFQGELFAVATSYDPSDNSLTIAEPVAEAWLEWLASHNNLWSDRDPPSEQQYLYLRRWTGGSGIADAPDHAFVPGNPVLLAGTGLSVRFSDFGLPGSFWVAAARPHTPDTIVPWELLNQAPPAGPRFFFAPLALINWRIGTNGELETTLRDCRQRFQPLCDARGCCTVTVGSGGQFASIEEAIDWLPEDGGKICLLPGTHRTRAIIAGRRNITISGCDKQTRVIPREDDLKAPIFQIVDSRCITLEHMEMVALAGTAVLMGASRGALLAEITVTRNRIVAAAYGIRVVRGRDVYVGYNHIRMLDKEGVLEAILALAEDCRIESNDIGVIPAQQLPPPDVPGADPTPDPTDPCAELELLYLNPAILTLFLDQLFLVLATFLPAAPFIALGGIRVAAASERVKIFDNTIIGGAGNGITLGGSGLDELRPDQGEPAAPVDVIDNRFQGVVQQNGVGVSGTTLVLASVDGATTQTAVTGTDGFVDAQVSSGRYNVTAVSPGQRISAVEPLPAGAGTLNRFTLDRFVDPDPDESIGFLYEIHIDDNAIGQMGLSGIGIPAPVAQLIGAPNQLSSRRASLNQVAALLGFPILSLDIHHNHIHDCMRNPFDGALRDLVQTRGLGAISLGFCENVVIDNNRIERIGSTLLNPTCGIFIGIGERVTISDNRVFDDRRPAQDVDLVPGVRGGIVVFVTAIGVDELLRFNPDRNLDNGQHAGRIYDNVIYQMIGQSLRVAAIGSLSIHDNRLNTEFAGSALLDRLAGSVLVLNLGGLGRLPEGDTLFSDNQCRLARGDSLSAQLIWSLDDLGYADNQSSALAEGLVLTDNITLFANTFLIGRTLRATNSRFKERSSFGREGDFRISLISRSVLMNNTSNNQGDHCIFPFDTLVVDAGNQELDNHFCEDIRGRVAVPVTGFSAAAMFDERTQFARGQAIRPSTMDTDPISDTLTQRLSELAQSRLASLSDSADLQTMTRALLEHEARRIQARFGENHPRTQQLRARLNNAKAQIDTLVAERERNQIQIPEVSPENALVHGIVSDKDRRGISGLMVCFTDDNDRPIRGIGEPVTDASGYFAFSLSRRDIKKLQSEHPNGVFIAVFSGAGDTLIQRQPKPLTLAPKDRAFVEIEVDRRRTIVLEPAEPPTDPNAVIVPDVLGQTESSAIATLEEAKLKVGERQSQAVPDPDRIGRVLAQEPQAGAEVAATSAVDIVIGATSAVHVPNLVGLNLEAAAATLEEKNLRLGKQKPEPVHDSDRVGLIITQEPKASAAVGEGTAVNVVVGAASVIQVPELVGLRLASARRKVKRSGLRIGSITKRISDRPDVVLEQNPAAATEVPVDSAVNIVVGEEKV